MPKVFSEDTMYNVIKGLIDESLNAKAGRVAFDYKSLELIGAGGVAVLSNVIELLKKAGVNVEHKNLDGSNCRAYKKLKDFGFVYKYTDEIAIPNRTVWRLPLKVVSEEGAYSYIFDHLMPWVASALKAEEGELSTLSVVCQEIFNNIIDHSNVGIGCACAQFDKSRGIIRICVSDFGVGIPNQVRALHPNVNDAAAIKIACKQGFTTQTTPRNRGAGLHTLINNITNTNKGKVDIYSYKGIKSIEHNKPRVVKNSQQSYPGTLIFITLDYDLFVRSAKQEHFEW